MSSISMFALESFSRASFCCSYFVCGPLDSPICGATVSSCCKPGNGVDVEAVLLNDAFVACRWPGDTGDTLSVDKRTLVLLRGFMLTCVCSGAQYDINGELREAVLGEISVVDMEPAWKDVEV